MLTMVYTRSIIYHILLLHYGCYFLQTLAFVPLTGFVKTQQQGQLIKNSIVSATQEETTTQKVTIQSLSTRRNNKDKTDTIIQTINQDDGDLKNKIPEKLVKCLDLIPLMESIALHAGTKRGYDALMSIVQHGQKQPKKRVIINRNMSRQGIEISSRKATLSSIDSSRTKIGIDENDLDINNGKVQSIQDDTEIFTIPQTILEVREEWYLLSEATAILKASKGTSSSSPSSDENSPIIPPFYGATSSPWDTQEKVQTDDDEWINILSKGQGGGSLEPENILQAEQVANKIMNVYEWASSNIALEHAPEIAKLCLTMDIDAVSTLYYEIEGSVSITQGKQSYMGKSYLFELNEMKYPDLLSLRRKRQYSSKKMKELSQYVSQQSSQMVKQLKDLDEEIAQMEREITTSLITYMMKALGSVNDSLNVIARIDTLFARAAFGYETSGVAPKIRNEGVITFSQFLHPVLAVESEEETIPINLSVDDTQKSLIISGQNAGGKTIAMKSFGLVALMTKLGIPIPQKQLPEDILQDSLQERRVDFFKDIIVEVGDNQDIMMGKSTYMAKLESLSLIVNGVFPHEADAQSNELSVTPSQDFSLILLDELGDGTDPVSGSCVAQAILEKLLQSDTTRTISTTHSPQLKALSYNDDRFNCATVNSHESTTDYGGYGLLYGIIGNSEALSAVSKTLPPLPEDVIERATNLIASNGDGSGDILRAVTLSLEQEKENAMIAAKAAREYEEDIFLYRDALISLSRAYDQHFSRLETRLDSIYDDLMIDDATVSKEIVGKSLASVRLVKKRVKSEEELLRERGLRIVSASYNFKGGESVVIIGKGDWEGETATVSMNQFGLDDDVMVVPDVEWGASTINDAIPTSSSDTAWAPKELTFKRRELAMWDYGVMDKTSEQKQQNNIPVRNVEDSRKRLNDAFKKISDTTTKKSPSRKKVTGSGGQFKSSRARRAASKKKRKNNK